MVGRGGCECDGFVSNTLSLSMVSHINPSLNGQPQSSVFQSHCVCCHFNQCVGASVLSHFCPLSNSILIGDCHLIAVCTMSCVCVGLVDVCCVMSSDGVWVWMMQCVSLSTQKRQHSTRPCLHVMVCTNASCCMVGGE